jgi:hypothetical protein
MNHLVQYLSRRTYGVVCAYHGAEIVGIIAGVVINDDDSLILHFPKVNPFLVGEKITIHLDNRTGIELFDIGLRVYRCSYKGIIAEELKDALRVVAEEYVVRYGDRSILEYNNPGYKYPLDSREPRKLSRMKLAEDILPDSREKENKLGVWITRGVERPHTTVMAFLSSIKDDIFVISHSDSYKSKLIHKDPGCMFAIDHRASYNFEKKYEWNYTIIRAMAEIIERDDPIYSRIQAMFVEKNPWEQVFFTDQKAELFHLEAIELMCPEKYGPK